MIYTTVKIYWQSMDNLFSNIKKITEQYLIFGVKNIFVSGLVYTTRVDVRYWKSPFFILDFGRKNCFIYIDNRNIRSDSLYKTRLHLIDKEKAFLGDNFIGYLDNIFKKRTYTIHQKIFG